MPKMVFTTRYERRQLLNLTDREMLNENRKNVYKQVRVTGKLKQEIITAGDPDGLGEFDPAEILVIRAEAEITEAEANRIRKLPK